MMMKQQKANITILQNLAEMVQKCCPNARDAVLIRVKNGLSVLTRGYGASYLREERSFDDEFVQKNALFLHGKPLLFAETNCSPTMAGMLARGYGREPYDFLTVRDRINTPFTDLPDAVDRIRPLLSLLDSGWYVIADVLQYPTDGENIFFANVSDEMRYYPAISGEMKCPETHIWVNGFPAYLYPSQSNVLLNPERAAFYAEQITQPDAPRAISYYIDGFMSILLDGHHKAYAAAMRGAAVPCIAIIPFKYSAHDCTDRENPRTYYCFGSIRVPAEMIPDFRYAVCKDDVQMPEQNIVSNEPVSEEMLQLLHYPNIWELVAYLASRGESETFSNEQMLNEPERFRFVMLYFARTEPEKGAAMAQQVLALENTPESLQYSAFEVLLDHKSPETESYFIDYIVHHNSDALCWDVVSSYWDDVSN